ncbi:hypothetical protein CL617_02495 [archaeon]|nr:hypothetical protein [archaeon]|tara:strand:+ start:2963 stop:6487 length:3525 start_codon:yes stop_codon:yes gene_type:complete
MKNLSKRVIAVFMFFLVAFMPLAQADEYVINDIFNKLEINNSELNSNVFSRELSKDIEVNFQDVKEIELGNNLDVEISNEIGGFVFDVVEVEKEFFIDKELEYEFVDLSSEYNIESVKDDDLFVSTDKSSYNEGEVIEVTNGIHHFDSGETITLYMKLIHEAGYILNFQPITDTILCCSSYPGLVYNVNVNDIINALGIGGDFYFSNTVESSDGATVHDNSEIFEINYPDLLLRGNIQDQDGNALEGVEVNLDFCTGYIAGDDVSDSDGYYEILTYSGIYNLEFVYDGITYIYADCGDFYPGFFDLNPILTTEVIIDGYFKKLDGEPLPLERFSLMNCNNEEIAYDYTDSNGYYVFNEKPGNYKLGVRYLGYDFTLTECLFFGNNARFTDLVLTTTVTGGVKDSTGNGVNNIKAKLIDVNGNEIAYDYTDSNGDYSIYTDAGNYKLDIEYKGFDFFSNFYTMVGGISFGDIYMVFDLNGYLKDLDNNPLVNYKVEVTTCNENSVDHDYTDGNGFFSIVDDADRYKIFINSPIGKFKLTINGNDCFFLFGDIDIGTININPYPDCSVYDYICYRDNIKLFGCYFDSNQNGCVCSGTTCEYGCTEGKLTCDLPNYGTINVDVDNLDNSPLKSSRIYIDSAYKGTTNSLGRLSTSAMYGYRNVEAYCPNNNFCDSKNVYVNGNEDAYFDCDCEDDVGDLRIKTLTGDGEPIANIYAGLDDEYIGFTNFLGIIEVDDVTYGDHVLDLVIKVGDDEPISKRYNVNVDEENEEKTVYITPENFGGLTPQNEDVYYSSIDEFEPNFVFTIPLLIYGAITVGGFIWDYGDFAKCMSGSDSWWGSLFDYTGFILKCKTPIVKLYTEDSCRQKMEEYSQNNVNSCTSEGVWLASNFVPIGGVFKTTGKLAIKLGKGITTIVPHVDDAFELGYRAVKNGDDVVVSKGTEKFFYKASGDVVKLTGNIAGMMVDIAKRPTVRNEIASKSKNVVNNMKKSDLPGHINKNNAGNIKGYLGEVATDEYINVVSKELRKEGADVITTKGTPGNVFKETNDYILKFDDTGSGLDIFKKGRSGKVGQLDGFVEVNGKPIIVETKTRLTANIDGEITRSDLLNKKFLPIKDIYGKKPEFILLRPNNIPIPETNKILKTLTENDKYYSKSGVLGGSYEFFDQKATAIAKEVLDGT